MGLLNEVERKSAGGRIFRGVVILILSIGAITMLYPFLLMLSTSVTTDLDYREYRLVPRYLTDDAALFRLYLHTRYGSKGFAEIRAKYRLGAGKDAADGAESYDDLKVDPALQPEWGGRQDVVLGDWSDFVRQLPEFITREYYISEFLDGKTQIEFQEFLKKKFAGNIEAFNRHAEAILPYPEFSAVDVPANTPGWHTWLPENTPLKALWREFKRGLPSARVNPVCMDQYYQFFLQSHYKTIDKLNQAWGAGYNAFSAIELPQTAPTGKERRETWIRFIRLQFPWYYMRVKGEHTSAWRSFLVRKYGSEAQYDALIRTLNGVGGAAPLPVLTNTVFTEIPPENAFLFKHWGEYIDAAVAPEDISLLTTEALWRAFLERKYGDVRSLSGAHGRSYNDFREVLPPWRLGDTREFLPKRNEWRRYFIVRNYRNVMVFITTKGRALVNTLILVVLTVVGQLLVQSAAAFALSRYKLSYAHKIILFLLATMAFPAEVAMIPGFLLLRNLGLLNTFAALILPGLCSGIGILWLKGYFDSLSKELFEAALIDGASEFRIFLNIVLPLAKPVLAVVALGSFTAAYSGFMWAFVTCQDPKMWTLMVWLYQFQTRAGVPAQMASFVVASLPTLLVFIFCQKIIMRGIVVPTLK